MKKGDIRGYRCSGGPECAEDSNEKGCDIPLHQADDVRGERVNNAHRTEGGLTPALLVRDLSFAYPDDTCVLDEVSFDIPDTSFTLLVGSTGNGKTTLLRLLKPELSPVGQKSGTVEVFGQALGKLDGATSASHIGYAAQDPENQIVCDTVWRELAFGLENLGVPQPVMRRRVAEIATFFGIEGWMHRSTAQLSGGQKQLLALASVLVMQPKILILDEPTAELDPVAEKNVLHALFRVNRELGMTILVATHFPERMAAYATDSLVLQEGRIVSSAFGDPFCQNGEKEACEYLSAKAKDDRRCVLATEADGCGVAKEAGGETEQEAHGNDRSSRKQDSVPEPSAANDGILPEKATAPHSIGVAIHVSDLYVRYGRSYPWVLRGLDLEISQGEVHALVGGNGVGKSTLLYAIAGSIKPQRGRVKNQLHHTQALVPQDPKALFVHDSVEEELAEWQSRCGYSDRAVDNVLMLVGLARQRASHPYDLSRGQQQKLAFARVILTRPRLLLLDEPGKALDAQARQELVFCIKLAQQAGITIVLATHDLDFVRVVADRISLAFDGQITCTETPEDYFKSSLFPDQTAGTGMGFEHPVAFDEHAAWLERFLAGEE